MSSPPFLSLRNIVKRFTKVVGGQTTLITAVDNVNLDIFLGQSVGIIGESGSGKTTLGKIMVKLLDPDGGTISFGQKDITRLKGSGLRDFRASVQMIFQDPYSSLDPKMRVKDLIADFYRLANKKPTREDILRQLELVSLDQDVADKLPHELSGGQRQRVAIARALSLNPKLIVADEPVSALDVSIRSQILQLLAKLQGQAGVTYVLITHDIATLPLLVDYIYVMYAGSIVESAPTRTLIDRPLHPYTKALISAVPDLDGNRESGLPIPPGDVEEATHSGGCKYYGRCPYAMAVCRDVEPSLRTVEKGVMVACHLLNR